MSKFTTKRIEEIRSLTTVDIPNEIQNGIDIERYLKLRMTLNITILQAILGSEFIKKKDETYKVKFIHRLPKNKELFTITSLIDDFIELENGFFKAYNDRFVDPIEDMEIPSTDICSNDLPELEKVNSKNVYEYIFGANGISRHLLTGKDIIKIAADAEKIKKAKFFKTMIITASALAILAGGAVATVAIVNNNKKKNENLRDPDIDVNDIDLVDITEDDIINEDTPKVDFDEAPQIELNEAV